MRVVSLRVIALVFLFAAPAATGSVLAVEQWRADIDQIDRAIRDKHFKPFNSISEADWAVAVDDLKERVPEMSDHDVMIAMAALVAKVNDGHTRLTLPVADWKNMNRFAHSSPMPPAREELYFSTIPIRFADFDGDAYVVAVAKGYEELLGGKVVRIGRVTGSEALAAARTATYRDNEQTLAFVAPNLLRMPQALLALGLASNDAHIDLVVQLAGGKQVERRIPASVGEKVLQIPDAAAQALRETRKNDKYFLDRIPGTNAIYLRVNEIGDQTGQESLVAYARNAVERAEKSKGKLVVDLRDNSGGNGTFLRGVVVAVMDSDHVNEYGNFYVLIGRNTFSAAQMLVNELERYTNVIFVGETTGANPQQYGDPEKLQLDNSNLTLRVSKLHWASWIAADRRQGTPPHVEAGPQGADILAGRDRALEAVLRHPSPGDGLGFFKELAGKRDLNVPAIVLLKVVTEYGQPDEQIGNRLVTISRELLREDNAFASANASYLGTHFYPDNVELQLVLAEGLVAQDKTEAAIKRYRKVLELDPRNAAAKAALDTLNTET